MIISIIESIANDMSLGFYHGRTDFQNLIADEQGYPALYLDQPITTNYNLSQSGYTSATSPVSILFLYKSELDWTPQQHDINCIQPAEAKLREFINRCEANPAIDSVSAITATEFINLFDANTSGKTLNVTLQVNNQYSVCANGGIDLTKGTVTNTEDTFIGEVGMGNTLAIKNETVFITDENDVLLDTLSIPVYKDTLINFEDYLPVKSGIAYQRPLTTGQTISYDLYDDAWQQLNQPYNPPPINPLYIQELDLITDSTGYTLLYDNAFGNKIRFTDDTGVDMTVTASNFIIDNLSGLMFINALSSGGVSFDNSMGVGGKIETLNNTSHGGYQGWKIPNNKEWQSIINWEDYISGSTMGFYLDNLPRNQYLTSTTFT